MSSMDVPIAWSILLLVAAGWNLFIWPQFLRRVRADERSRDTDGRATAFLKVHVVLITVSLALAIAIGVLGILTLV